MSWSVVVPVVGFFGGVLTMAFGFRKKEQISISFDEIDGVLKHDWARTGDIDFHARALDSASPQQLILRVEEQKITENAMGQDVAQLRWRLATLGPGLK
jgi:hypothetical protein